MSEEDDRPTPDDEESAEQPVTRESPARVEAPRHRRRWPWVLAAVIVSPVLIVTLWTWLALTYTYSHGERAGYVQKFSKKGWVCKTWEGELAMINIPGAMQQQWEFSVRSDSVAELIQRSMGKQVALTYDEHGGVPTDCFGETRYFVTGVRLVNPSGP